MSIEDNNNNNQQPPPEPVNVAFIENQEQQQEEEIPLPEVYKEKINSMGGIASEAVLRMHRPVYINDLTKHRCFLPGDPIKSIVTETEREKLDEGFPHGWIKVLLLDPSLDESTIYLEEDPLVYPGDDFDYEGYQYCLSVYWDDVLEHNDLPLGTTVQLWSFRLNSSSNDLCFALLAL